MKFFCEYCGCRIDSNKDDKCPNCGASYRKNQDFIKYESQRKERIERQEKDAEDIRNFAVGQFKTAKKMQKLIFAISIIIFITIFVLFAFSFFRMGIR